MNIEIKVYDYANYFITMCYINDYELYDLADKLGVTFDYIRNIYRRKNKNPNKHFQESFAHFVNLKYEDFDKYVKDNWSNQELRDSLRLSKMILDNKTHYFDFTFDYFNNGADIVIKSYSDNNLLGIGWNVVNPSEMHYLIKDLKHELHLIEKYYSVYYKLNIR